MKTALIFWGDPHSALALQNAIEGNIEIKYMISVFSKIPDSLASYYPNIKLLRLISEATDIPLVYKTLENGGNVLPLIEDSLKGIKREIDAVVIGEHDVSMHRKYESLFRTLGLRTVNPLLGIESLSCWESMLQSGFKIFVTAADSKFSDWVGRSINKDNLNDFLNAFDASQKTFPPELETVVLDCPAYKRKIEILEGREAYEGNRAVYITKNAILLEKNKI